MSHFQSLAAPWSRSARREDIPRTPEPNMSSETLPPSPPRPRFRIKRRNASNLNAPTEQFLASVAAADIPIPSIEEPRVLDEEMEETLYPVSHFNDLTGMPFTPHEAPGRMFSPPRLRLLMRYRLCPQSSTQTGPLTLHSAVLTPALIMSPAGPQLLIRPTRTLRC
ncbi:hypothetical protein NXS19_001211 [Fusarium pseudograminearum]|nr:hypothetical protein NXS19_001211 [Fusarium pseudograminearum]